MKLTTVLFDLDGTLLPMDQDQFIKGYFSGLIHKFSPLGYEPAKMQLALMAGIGAMMKNEGRMTNEQAFWFAFEKTFPNAAADKAHFDAFYQNEFQAVQCCCGFDTRAAALVRKLKGMGLRVVLATNPLFPAIATQSRIRWAGLNPDEFEWVTTYENERFCKPALAYYEQILERIGVPAQECLMVGNDVQEDMIVQKLGMKVFLLTDCLINKNGVDIAQYPNGSFDKLKAYILNLMSE